MSKYIFEKLKTKMMSIFPMVCFSDKGKQIHNKIRKISITKKKLIM